MKKKSLIALTATLMLAGSITSFTSAAQVKSTKKVDATFASIKVLYNNSEVETDLEPFMINGVTYIPLRMMGNVFNKTVDWDGAKYQIRVSEKADPNASGLAQQLAIKNNELVVKDQIIRNKDEKIAALEKEIAELKKTSTQKSSSIADLEDLLNDEFASYKGIKFKIALSGDKYDVTVKITVDLDRYQSKWDDLTSSNKKSYLQDIVDEILDEYEDADVEGTIKSGSKQLVSFTVSSSGKINMKEGSSSKSISSLKSYINDRYEDYFTRIPVTIDVTGDEDETDFRVKFSYTSSYKTRWDDLSDSEIKTFMGKIYSDIEDEYPDSDIMGSVYDTNKGKTLATYSKSSSGTVKFQRTKAY